MVVGCGLIDLWLFCLFCLFLLILYFVIGLLITNHSTLSFSFTPHSALIAFTLVYHVLLHLQKSLSLGSFFRLLEDGGPALAPAAKLLQVYAREQNREMLRDFYYSDDRRVDSAVLVLEEARGMVVSVFLGFVSLFFLD